MLHLPGVHVKGTLPALSARCFCLALEGVAMREPWYNNTALFVVVCVLLLAFIVLVVAGSIADAQSLAR